MNNDQKYENILIKTRENHKKSIYFVKMKNDYFSISEIVVFKECVVTSQQLIKRIKQIRSGIGKTYTMWDAITKTLANRWTSIDPIPPNKQRKSQLKKISKEEENTILYNMTMKLMKVGSLRNNGLIMQGKSY